MHFSFPGLLWALGLLAIPIIIHLFYFRRYKQVYFTNVRFLKELVEETSHRNKLKNLLILACRLLAFAALIFAFAQPFFKDQKMATARHKAVSIFIDNSWSMNSSSSEGSLFIKAKKSAFDIIQAYSEFDKFQIVTHELSGKQTQLYSKPEALTALEAVVQGSTVNSFSKIVKKQQQALSGADGFEKEIFIISDFQKSITDPILDTFQTNIKINLYPLVGVKEANIAIDTAYFINPAILKNQNNQLLYTLKNYGHEDVENIKFSYSIQGQEYPVQGINLKSGKTVTDTLNINISSSGPQKLILKIADFPVQFDDQYYLSFQAEEEIKVLVIHNKKPPTNLLQALQSIPYFKSQLQDVGAITYGNFKDYRLIILSDLQIVSSGLADELKKTLQNGTNIFVFPAENLKDGYASLQSSIRLPGLTNFTISKKEVGSIIYESGLFDDVFMTKKSNIKLPIVSSSYQFTGNSFNEPLLKFKDGSSYVIRYASDNGFVYVSSSSADPEINSLSKNAEIFLPLLFKASVSGKNTSVSAYTLGIDQIIQLPVKENVTLKDNTVRCKGPEEFITSARLAPGVINIEMFDQLKKSGIYDAYNQDQLLGTLAFNENRKESPMEFVPKDELQKYFGENTIIIDPDNVGNLTASLKDTRDKQSLWWFLILAGLLFLIFESLLIRYWKNK
ncbi:MAG: hypothetical protein HOP11_05735 [Saprospiraceae bacterium]|nr:hypothetical protein [Saprospiraceae bacterium]